MSDLRTAAQQALEALESLAKWEHPASNITTKIGRIYPHSVATKAASALRDALSEPATHGCRVCGNTIGYVCQRDDCPTQFTCGV